MSSDRLMSPSSAPASNNAAGSLEEKLSQLLTADSQFSVAAYLNLALQQETASSASSSNSTEDSLQSRMAELALQLQFQTQACHDDIGRIGAEGDECDEILVGRSTGALVALAGAQGVVDRTE